MWTPKPRQLPPALLAPFVLFLPLRFLLSASTCAGFDLVAYFAPHADVGVRALLREGKLPLWDPYQFAGTPILGGLVGGLFYPPHLVFLLAPLSTAFEILFALHFALAAFGTYRLSRGLGASRPAAGIAAAAFSLSLSLVARLAAGHYGPFVTVSQAPLLLFLLHAALRRPRIDRAALLAAAGGLVLLSGHPPFVYQLGGLAALWTLAWSVAARKQARPIGRPLGFVAAAGAAALLLAAVDFLPALEVRGMASRGDVQAGAASLTYSEHAFLPRDASSFFIPILPRSAWLDGAGWRGYGYEKAVYLGVLPLLLAVAALVFGPRRGLAGALAALAAAGVAAAAAIHLPLHELLTRTIPGYGLFRVPGRLMWIVALALALLAGLGWDRWRAAESGARRRFLGAALGVTAALAAGFGLRYGPRPEIFCFVGLLLVSTALLARAPSSGWAALVFIAAELTAQGFSVVPSAERPERSEPPWYAASLGPDPGRSRVLDLTSPDYPPARHGVRMLHGYGYPLPRATERLYASAWDAEPPRAVEKLLPGRRIGHSRALDLLNVEWLVCAGPPPEEGLSEIARSGDRGLYRRPHPRPAAWAGEQALALERGADSLELRAVLDAPGVVVVSESWMPGWRAEANGSPVAVEPHERALMQVRLPAGDHRLSFRYRPWGFLLGRWLSALTLVALGVLAWKGQTMRRGG